jgi:hypothetical protein
MNSCTLSKYLKFAFNGKIYSIAPVNRKLQFAAVRFPIEATAKASHFCCIVYD